MIEKILIILFLSLYSYACSGDCFSCHSQNKLIESNRFEHQNLATCKECHINKEDLFKNPSMNGGSSLADLLNNK